jgi:hypothetical protein
MERRTGGGTGAGMSDDEKPWPKTHENETEV